MFTGALLVAGSILSASPALAQNVPAAGNDQIVITGTSLTYTEKALADCVARRCPPDQEIAAAIAHAENQFVAGRYSDARSTLAASSRRNKRYAKEYPVPVSDMLRAGSRVAAHLGEGRAYFSGALDVISALKAGLPDDDARVLVARTELADAYARVGRREAASNLYREVARDAERLSLPIVEGFARLRDAALWSVLAMDDPAYRGNAKNKLAAIIANPDPAQAVFAKQAKVLQIRLAARDGDTSGVDALIAEYRKQPVKVPVLLASEPVKLWPTRLEEEGTSGSVTRLAATQDVEDQWIDVGFWIAPDGRTTDVDILRDSGKAEPDWTDPVLASIRSRRYAPLALGPTEPGLLRVERYTLTSDWTTNSGSRMRVRSNAPRLEMLDLSTENTVPSALKVQTAS